MFSADPLVSVSMTAETSRAVRTPLLRAARRPSDARGRASRVAMTPAPVGPDVGATVAVQTRRSCAALGYVVVQETLLPVLPRNGPGAADSVMSVALYEASSWNER